MRFYVGVTNNEWFADLSARRPDEVNFWRPKNQNRFRALEVGAPFLFKLRSPNHRIAGGGLFVRHTLLPLNLMWQAFGTQNGAPDLETLRRRILGAGSHEEPGRQFGCIILAEPFFFAREEADFKQAADTPPRNQTVGDFGSR